MLEVVMCGKEQVACIQFWDDAADRPNIARLLPLTALQNDLRRAILPGIDDGAMSFAAVGSSSEIYQFYTIVIRQHIVLYLLMRSLFEFAGAQQNILGF